MRARILAFGILAVLGVAGPDASFAAEPSGHAELGYTWETADGESPSASGLLTITLQPFAPLAAAEVSFAVPKGVELRAADGSPVPGDGEPRMLGDVAAGATRVLTFEVQADPGAGGIAVIRFGGILADGTRVAETMGIPVGVAGPRPTSRNGAAEYPASTAGSRRP